MLKLTQDNNVQVMFLSKFFVRAVPTSSWIDLYPTLFGVRYLYHGSTEERSPGCRTNAPLIQDASALPSLLLLNKLLEQLPYLIFVISELLCSNGFGVVRVF